MQKAFVEQQQLQYSTNGTLILYLNVSFLDTDQEYTTAQQITVTADANDDVDALRDEIVQAVITTAEGLDVPITLTAEDVTVPGHQQGVTE